jgi:uroporphyrinogen-III synthase
MRVVLTRPQHDSERTAAALRARGHAVLIAPLLRIEPVDAALRPDWGGVIITSANAAAALALHPARDALTKLPLFAVGKRTADAARNIGFSDIVTAGGDVRDLMRVIVAHRADAKAPMLYLAGEDRAADVIGELSLRGIAAELVVIYRAAAAPFPLPLIAALQADEVDAVLHFSRRSTETYLIGAEAAGLTAQAQAPRHICLSEQAAEPLRSAGAVRIVVAKRADEAALIELLEPAKA